MLKVEIAAGLRPEGLTYAEVARWVYRVEEPTRAHMMAVGRAARRLAELGRVELGETTIPVDMGWFNGQPRWTPVRVVRKRCS